MDSKERSRTAARWMLTLVEPLLSPEDRYVIEQDMIELVAGQPRWSAAWFAGMLYEIGATLPAGDPWAEMSARLDYALSAAPRLGERLVEPGSAGEETLLGSVGRLPAGTGAMLPSGNSFGTYRSVIDLISGLDTVGPDEDRALIAVATPLQPAAAALVAIAASRTGADPDWLANVLGRLHVALHAEDPLGEGPKEWLGLAGSALRWLTKRRLSYVQDDMFVAALGYAWCNSAEEAAPAQGGGRPLADLATNWPSGLIPPGRYEMFKLEDI